MKKCRIFSVISFLIFLAATGLFLYQIYRSQLVPKQYLLIGLALIVIVVLLLAFLVFKAKSRFLIVSGGILCLLFGVVFLVVAISSGNLINTMQKNTNENKEVEQQYDLNVYMLADETDENTSLSAEMTFGRLKEQEKEETDKVISELESTFNCPLKIMTYEKPIDLIDALLNHQVDAIILCTRWQASIESNEGYGDKFSSLRIIKQVQIKVVVSPPDNQSGTSEETAMTTGTEEIKKTGKECFIVYISGIDTRLNDLVENSRSDTNILAVVNPESHQILLLTTPRDYYVPLKFPDFVSSRDKLTHAGIYGVQVSMDTLGMLYDIDIDYYFRVNFGGFVDIVEAMGGVTVYVEKEFSTTEYTFKEGPNELNGYKALSFVRNRFGIGDQQRGRNQMAFVKGVINKATSTDMLLNFNSILKAVDGCFETSMPYDVISALVRDQIETGAEWNVVTYAVTGTGNSAIPYSMNIEVYVMDPDMSTVETAKGLIQQVLAGETVTQPGK